MRGSYHIINKIATFYSIHIFFFRLKSQICNKKYFLEFYYALGLDQYFIEIDCSFLFMFIFQYMYVWMWCYGSSSAWVFCILRLTYLFFYTSLHDTYTFRCKALWKLWISLYIEHCQWHLRIASESDS